MLHDNIICFAFIDENRARIKILCFKSCAQTQFYVSPRLCVDTAGFYKLNEALMCRLSIQTQFLSALNILLRFWNRQLYGNSVGFKVKVSSANIKPFLPLCVFVVEKWNPIKSWYHRTLHCSCPRTNYIDIKCIILREQEDHFLHKSNVKQASSIIQDAWLCFWCL